MICTKCGGKGDYFNEVYNDGKRRRETLIKCDKCNGTGEVQMTNEEWFATLSTEEKAKTIANATYSSAMMGAEITALPKEDEVRKWKMWLKAPHDWAEWLKQPRTPNIT